MKARVASGQIDAILVGGSYNAERPDVLVIHEMGGYLRRGGFAGLLVVRHHECKE